MTSSLSEDTTLTVTRLLKAPREKVFRAWTDPEQIRKWWNLGEGWTTTVVEVDLRVGGGFHIEIKSVSDGAVHKVTGNFREVISAKRLVYTWITEDSGKKSEETLVTVEFRDQGNHTELFLKHQFLTDSKLRGSVDMGWQLVLNGLMMFIDGKW